MLIFVYCKPIINAVFDCKFSDNTVVNAADVGSGYVND